MNCRAAFAAFAGSVPADSIRDGSLPLMTYSDAAITDTHAMNPMALYT